MSFIQLDHWLQQILAIWQSLADHAWQQDAFMLLVCLFTCLLLLMTGTVLGLFVQSIWGIFISSRQTGEEH